jgi:hypothetical protein
MNEHLRERVVRKLEGLSDERGYQVLDYIEFLESKYAARQTPPTNIFTRFSEAVEDRLRAGKVSATTIAETVSLMNRAFGALNNVATGVAAAGRSVASDFATATRNAGGTGGAPTAARTSGATAATSPPPASSAPGDAARGPTSGSSGAPVAGSGVTDAAAAGAPPADAPAPASSDEPSATESGELEPPAGP